MKAVIEYGYPGDEFWRAYDQLWKSSFHQPVFQSPNFLKVLAARDPEAVAVYQCYREENLIGAAFFRGQGDTHFFLSDYRTDHNFFVLAKDTSEAERGFFFRELLHSAHQQGWALLLNNQAAWAVYWPSFMEALAQSRLHCEKLVYSACPVFSAETPAQIERRLNKSKNTRYKKNRLIREHDPVFEIFCGAEALDEWVTDFAESHIARWENTNTPSVHNQVYKRHLLKKYLQAWITDRRLVRFSINAGGKRIAFCIGLLQENSLIHHSHTYDIEFGRYSPGKILLGVIGQWMQENGLNVLDFGQGNESFKYKYANEKLELMRLFIASSSSHPFILKAKFIKKIRENEAVYNFYRDRVKPILSKIGGK